MENNINLVELLEYIEPSFLDYQDWVNVGMALKYEGYTVQDWDDWSKRDANRYHAGECEKKWNTFSGSSSPITAGTIVKMAQDNGFKFHKEDVAFDWNSEIGNKDDLVVIDKGWIETSEFSIPQKWNPVEQLTTYLETLFEANENVGYVLSLIHI